MYFTQPLGSLNYKKRVPKVLTFEGIELLPSVFLGQRISVPYLYYKFTSLTNHLMQEHKTLVDENLEDPLAINSGIRSLGKADLDQEIKDQVNDDAEITFMGATAFDQVMEEADSNVESILDDEVLSIYGDDDEEDNLDRELFIAESVVADHVVNEILTKVNKEDTYTIVSATTTKEFADKMNSAASSVPSLISHAVAQQLPDLLTLAIKYNLPWALTNAVKEILPGFNRRIKTAIKGEMPAILTTSILKPMYKEFNALNKLESQMFVMLEKKICKSTRK
nr:hypothetical protein [Tanacetum cinerariifolium]